MTFAEFAANEQARQELAQLLNKPVLKAVLEMMQEANLPTFMLQIPGTPPNMDPLTAIALSSTLRAGFQQCIRSLKKLPYLNTAGELQIQSSGAWEWTAQPEKPTTKKRRTKQ